MELPIALQGSQFLLAALLGLIYGLCYDLLRGLRRNAKPLTHPSDLIFGLLCLLGNLLFAFYIGQKQVVERHGNRHQRQLPLNGQLKNPVFKRRQI